MRIIKEGKLPGYSKQLTCDWCDTIFEVNEDEAKYTDYLGWAHDGLPERNVKCPLCDKRIYFSFKLE